MKFAALALAAALLISALPALAEEWEESFLKTADQIPLVDYGALLYQRSSRGDPRIADPGKILDALLAKEIPFDQLVSLSDHKDSRVRSLALMKLYATETHEAFRVIQRHAKDEAPSFPAFQLSSSFRAAQQPISTSPQSVGGMASKMLEMIGYPSSWTRVDGSNPPFDAWAKPRLGNPDWIGWQDFLFRRVSGGTMPMPRERQDKLDAFKKSQAALPAAVRTWTWLGVADDYLGAPAYDTPLASEAEIIAAARDLGADALLAFLRDGSRAGLRQARIDDPDRGKRFILLHGKQLFREQDAAGLVKMGHFAAAADADPKNASAIIRQGLAALKETYQDWDRARAMAALLDLRAEAETDFVVEWFYATPDLSTGSTDQSVFIHEYERRKPADWKTPVSRLVAHPGFERLKPLDVIYVALLVNRLSGNPVFAEDLLHDEREAELRNKLREHFGLPLVKSIGLTLPATPPVEAAWESGIEGKPTSLSLSPDAQIAAVGREEAPVLLFEVSSGKPLGELAADGGARSIQFRKEDGALLVLSSTGTLTEWDVKDRKQLRQSKPGEIPFSEVAISASGGLIAHRATEGISVFDLAKGLTRWKSPRRIRAFGTLGISDDGSRVVACDGFGKELLLFDGGSPQAIATLAGHSGTPKRACFSPDGRYLLSTGEDTKLIVWDGRTGALLHEYQNPRSRHSAIGFSADSKSAIARFDHEHLLVFEVASGKALQSLRSKCNWGAEIECTPDGKFCIEIEVGQGFGARNPNLSQYRLKAWKIAGE